jgi:pantetheine-phosphate adenylyltransferase
MPQNKGAFFMEKIVFAGSFDPLTNGHLWVIQEGLEIAQKVVVFIAQNINKKNMFSAEKRKKMIEDSCAEKGFSDRVEVVVLKNEYVATRALQVGATHLIRGIRSPNDFDYEALIQKTNTDVLEGAKTIFVMPPRDLESVSSSFVKSLMGPVGWHWHIKDFLPTPVYEEVLKDFISKVAFEHITDKRVSRLLDTVFNNYTLSDRHYHNLEHIAHCLQEMLWYKFNSEETANEVNYAQLCAAILGHDIIYGAKQETPDEVLSAELLVKELGITFMPSHNLILATQHFKEKKDFNDGEKLMRSIDLAILAQGWKIYSKYAENVRQEYSFVSDEDYVNGRSKVLEMFINQETIFEHNGFAHYEELAKQNLKKELENLNNKRKVQ